MEDYSEMVESTTDSASHQPQKCSGEMNGLGGYGDEDFTDVKSLIALNKDGIGPEKVDNFKDFPEIIDKTKDKLKNLGITFLFPIQAECFRPIFKGQDVIGRDLTGSGKTLAF